MMGASTVPCSSSSLTFVPPLSSYRVCELLYERLGAKEKILDCYLRDAGRSDRVFPYLRAHLRKEDEVIKSRAPELINVDAEEFACFVANVRPDLVDAVIGQLGEDCDSFVLRFACNSSLPPDLKINCKFKTLFDFCNQRFLDALLALVNESGSPKGLELNASTWELYFQKLAVHRPAALVYSLKKFDGHFRFDPVYKVCIASKPFVFRANLRVFFFCSCVKSMALRKGEPICLKNLAIFEEP